MEEGPRAGRRDRVQNGVQGANPDDAIQPIRGDEITHVAEAMPKLNGQPGFTVPAGRHE